MKNRLPLALRLRLFVVVGVVFLLGALPSCAPEPPPDPEPPKLAGAAPPKPVVPLDDMEAASQALRQIMESSGRKGLPKLLLHRDQAVSLHAAWELAKGDRKKAEAFLTHFASSQRVAPPGWWSAYLRGLADANPWRGPGAPDGPPGHGHRLASGGVVVRPDSDGEGQPDESIGASYALVAEGPGAKAAWKAEVWATAAYGVFNGPQRHDFELVLSEGRVFAFGADCHGAYAEAFRLEDGSPVLRFCTCYWGSPSEQWRW